MQHDTNPIGIIDIDDDGIARVVYHHGQALKLALLVHVAHVNDLVLQLLHRPDLAAPLLALHQDGRLTHKRPSLHKRQSIHTDMHGHQWPAHSLTLLSAQGKRIK